MQPVGRRDPSPRVRFQDQPETITRLNRKVGAFQEEFTNPTELTASIFSRQETSKTWFCVKRLRISVNLPIWANIILDLQPIFPNLAFRYYLCRDFPV